MFGPDEVIPTVTGPRPPPIIVVIPLDMASSTSPALSKCTCTSMAPAVAIMPSPARISVPAPMIRSVDAGHRSRVPRLPDAGNAAVPDTDVGLADSQYGVDDQDVGDDEVQRAVGIGESPCTPCLRAWSCRPEHRLVAVDGGVVFDLRQQLGVSQPDTVPGGGPVQFGVVTARDAVRHVTPPSTRL